MARILRGNKAIQRSTFLTVLTPGQYQHNISNIVGNFVDIANGPKKFKKFFSPRVG